MMICDSKCLSCSYWYLVFNVSEYTELHRLVLRKDLTLRSIRKLVERENTDANYDTPLQLEAKRENNYEIFTKLINAGAELQVCISFKNTPLHMAVLYCSRKATELLLHSSASVDSRNIHGNTPLHLAVKCFLYPQLEGKVLFLAQGGLKKIDKVIVEKLIHAGADVNITNIFEETPLLRAVEAGDSDVVKELLKYGADANYLNPIYTSCLHLALYNRFVNPDQELLEELIKYGANINLKEDFLKTPLDIAIERDFKEQNITTARHEVGNARALLELKKAKTLIRMGVLVNPELTIDLHPSIDKRANISLHIFLQKCSFVVGQMKAVRITDAISLYDFALRGMNCTVCSSNKLEDYIFSKALRAFLKGDFDLYNDILEYYLPKLFLKKVLMNISINTINETSKRRIELFGDVIWLLCDYLNKTDMLRLIKAVSNELSLMIE